MPRLSLWRDGKHTNDYKFFDRRISEMFTVGGTGILIHKYLGPTEQGTVKSTSSAQNAAGVTVPFSSTGDIDLGMFVVGTNIPANATVAAKTATTITLSAATTAALGSGSEVKFFTEAAKPRYINDSA